MFFDKSDLSWARRVPPLCLSAQDGPATATARGRTTRAVNMRTDAFAEYVPFSEGMDPGLYDPRASAIKGTDIAKVYEDRFAVRVTVDCPCGVQLDPDHATMVVGLTTLVVAALANGGHTVFIGPGPGGGVPAHAAPIPADAEPPSIVRAVEERLAYWTGKGSLSLCERRASGAAHGLLVTSAHWTVPAFVAMLESCLPSFRTIRMLMVVSAGDLAPERRARVHRSPGQPAKVVHGRLDDATLSHARRLARALNARSSGCVTTVPFGHVGSALRAARDRLGELCC